MPDKKRKITAFIPDMLLREAQEVTEASITETLIEGLKRIQRQRAGRELRKLRGTFKFNLDIKELRKDREFK